MTDTSKYKNIRHLQIQPKYTFREEWTAFAESEGLSYEVLELSAPPALNESGFFKTCRDWYLETGRVTSVHGYFIDINPASGDLAFRTFSQKKCRESCEIAEYLGAKNVVFHGSCFPFLRERYLEAWAGVCAEFYERLAEEYQMNIFVENSFDIDTVPLKELMHRVYDKRVGVCLDLGHANYSNDPIEKWFEDLGDKIGYIHISDNMGQYDDHVNVGEGTVDWEKADRLWRELDRDMPVTLEVEMIDDIRISIDYLRSNGFFLKGNE